MPTVLVTGATGFLGGALLARLLQTQPSCAVIVLARGDSPEQARERVCQSVARFLDRAESEQAFRNVEVLCGDLTDVATFDDPRFDRVTHVCHLAANTSFRSVRTVRRTNIDGTLNLARRLERVAGLVRFLHVGTAYICGASPGAVVREEEYPRPDVAQVAEYTHSKAECELQLAEMQLPLIVARPSVVVGHTRLGCGPSSSLFWYYRTVALLRRVASPLARRKDIVPVDYVAEALRFLLFKPQLQHRRYHISAGEVSSVTWREMLDGFADCYGLRSEEPCRVVDFATILEERGRLRTILGPGDEDRLLRGLEMLWRFSATGVEVFDNRRLLGEGLEPPPKFTSYLKECATLPANRSVYEQMDDDG
jgi:nucleoside-diphosphate-sugar epimerase